MSRPRAQRTRPWPAATLGYEPWWWPPRGRDPVAWLVAMQEVHAASPLDDVAPPDCLPPQPADHGWRPITKPVAGEAFGAYSRGMYALAWPMVAGWGVLVKRWSGGRWRTVSALGVSDRRDARDQIRAHRRRVGRRPLSRALRAVAEMDPAMLAELTRRLFSSAPPDPAVTYQEMERQSMFLPPNGPASTELKP